MCDFESAVKQAVNNIPQDLVYESCPDQFVGILNSIKADEYDFPCRLEITDENVPDKLVLLILESPHEKKFISPFGPAKGSTGCLIRRYIHEIIRDQVSDNYGLLLVNAIGNQCSLGFATDKYRDVVFVQAWKLYGKNEFIIKLQNLKSIHELFVINACTKGKGGILRELVEEGVVDALKQKSDIRITHPASWASASNRVANW